MDNDSTVFEIKILESTCILLVFTSFLATLNNYFLGLEFELTVITFVLFFLSIISWWILVRYKYFKAIRLWISILLLAIINVVWYLNYASYGPTIGFYILLVFLLTFIWPLKKALYFTAFIILNIIILFYVELEYPDLLLRYSSEHNRVIDTYVTAFFIIGAAFVFASFARSSYLKKYHEAKKSNEVKTFFLQSMSHELRTPLNAIIGFSEIIDEHMTKDEIISFVKIINSSGNHLLNLVEDIFDVTHIESGEIKIVKEDFELHRVLNEIKEIIGNEKVITKKQHIDLLLKIPATENHLTLSTDQLRLKQILLNLLKNALKFTSKGHIAYGYEHDLSADRPVLKFFVEDTGVGIEEKNREIIFKAFAQLKGSTTRPMGGAGLGLAISKKLTELLGGKIWMESTPGKGSTFYFTIPYIIN